MTNEEQRAASSERQGFQQGKKLLLAASKFTLLLAAPLVIAPLLSDLPTIRPNFHRGHLKGFLHY